MPIVRFDPWNDLFGIQRDLSDLLQRTLGDTTTTTQSRRRGASFVPPVDVFSRDGSLVIRAELPGVKPEQVDVTVHNGVLFLRGERRHEEKVDEGRYYRMESSYGYFERQIQLPEGADADNISARYLDGVLEVAIPSTPAVQPKKVQIELGESGDAGTDNGHTDTDSEAKAVDVSSN